jgi:hypothetical protein
MIMWKLLVISKAEMDCPRIGGRKIIGESREIFVC